MKCSHLKFQQKYGRNENKINRWQCCVVLHQSIVELDLAIFSLFCLGRIVIAFVVSPSSESEYNHFGSFFVRISEMGFPQFVGVSVCVCVPFHSFVKCVEWRIENLDKRRPPFNCLPSIVLCFSLRFIERLFTLTDVPWPWPWPSNWNRRDENNINGKAHSSKHNLLTN